MTTTAPQDNLDGLGTYKFGWADSDVAGTAARRGLSEDVSPRHLSPEGRAGVDAWTSG